MLANRYPTAAGVRLDHWSDPQEGVAIDLHRDGNRKSSLWVRDANNDAVKIELWPEDLQALRDGASRLLVDLGVERTVTVNVNKP